MEENFYRVMDPDGQWLQNPGRLDWTRDKNAAFKFESKERAEEFKLSSRYMVVPVY